MSACAKPLEHGCSSLVHRGVKIKMALKIDGNLPILAEETSSLETANEVAALGGTTFNVWKCCKIDMIEYARRLIIYNTKV